MEDNEINTLVDVAYLSEFSKKETRFEPSESTKFINESFKFIQLFKPGYLDGDTR